jgi:tripartite-type tricarboxylate transporter receptor subunit TctC
MKRLAVMMTAVCAMGLVSFEASAIDKSRPIRIVHAFPAGGVTDTAGRIVAEGLTHELGQTVIVENKPGGDGVIGMLEVVKAKPDGNTLLGGGFGGQLIPPLMKKEFPVDVEKQLVPLARTAGFSNVLVVPKNFPVNSVAELIDYAKKNPGKLNYGSAASASSDRLTTEMFAQRAGLKLTWVPYGGGPAALNDLSSGVIQLMFANVPAAIGLIQGGNIKAIAVSAPTRVPTLPTIPTMQEQGMTDFDVTSWISLFGPAGMSEADIKALSEAIVRVVAKPETQEKLRRVGFEPIGEGAEAFKKSFLAEKTRWKAVIDNAGLVQ